ncbi:hypothetical protein [Nocardioides marmoribigeumensis]|uniref:Anti-sigma factor n=1 Tax=Nocardioides marmoribigeumensis TaxID=433649 RepID=A0ABU2BWT7_9ACTN|nr:hypothetical protein [Nocardioides marmoribigeumensis]MDR7362864.1 hypothetical protein [Nocardioides marmoribigeumensis]
MTRAETTAQLSETARARVERARAVRADVELLVEPPGLASIERRGRARRRRRHATAAALATTLVVAGVGVAGELSRHRPVDTAGLTWPAGLDRWPGNPHLPQVRAGDHWFPLSPYRDAPTVRLRLGRGWHGDVASVDLQHRAGAGLVTLLVADVDQVVRTPCDDDDRGMVDVTDDPATLVAAVAGAPGLEQRAPARVVTAFGRPATWLRLSTTEAVRCPFHTPYHLVDTGGGLVQAPRPGSRVDVWVVDVDHRGVVVAATATPGADERGRAVLEEALSTVRLVPGGSS